MRPTGARTRATPEALRGLAEEYNGREVGDGGLIQRVLLDAAQHIEGLRSDAAMMLKMLDRADALTDQLRDERNALRAACDAARKLVHDLVTFKTDPAVWVTAEDAQ